MDVNGNGLAQNDEIKPVALKFAPAWKRALAFGIDFAVLWLIICIMLTVVYQKEFYQISLQGDFKQQIKLMEAFLTKYTLKLAIVSFILETSYFTLGWLGNLQTIGARILHVAVISISNRKINIIEGILRYSIISLSARLFYIPLLFIFNPVYKQRIMDFFVNTAVVEIPEGMPSQFNHKINAREEEKDDDSLY